MKLSRGQIARLTSRPDDGRKEFGESTSTTKQLDHSPITNQQLTITKQQNNKRVSSNKLAKATSMGSIVKLSLSALAAVSAVQGMVLESSALEQERDLLRGLAVAPGRFLASVEDHSQCELVRDILGKECRGSGAQRDGINGTVAAASTFDDMACIIQV